MESGLNLSEMISLQPFRVTWKDITYTSPQQWLGSAKSRTILSEVSGYFDSGKVTAIMGPSGCGKSSLLGCLSKQKTNGVTGSITISRDIDVKFAFIAQDNYILDRLSVRESIMFASRLKNDPNANHKTIVDEVIHKLLIEKCADNRPSRCSGGQLKRVLIACELVSKPNILILDEPTSGLDSVTTWQLINLLIDLTRSADPVAIVITIHQPSARLFNLLDQVYLMSCEGQCIYNGPPRAMLPLFGQYGLICPAFTNPSDFALEVAANEHGRAQSLKLSTAMKIEAMDLTENKYLIQNSRKSRILKDIIILTERSLITMVRDPIMFPTRVFGYIFCSIQISLFFGFDSGIFSGCSDEFAITGTNNLMERINELREDLTENCCAITFTCLLAWFGGIFPVLLTFPTELNIFLKEYGNGYYSAFSYFMSKVLSDIPFSLVLPNIASIPIYLMTGQYMGQLWRLSNFGFIYILLTFNSSALGFLLGALLSDYPTAIAFLGTLSFFPLIILSGIMISVTEMPIAYRWLTHVNYLRFGLVACLLNSYGFDRCAGPEHMVNRTDLVNLIPSDKLIEIYSSDKIDSDLLVSSIGSLLSGSFNGDHRSHVLQQFNLIDSDYYIAILMLVFHMAFYRFCTYLAIQSKILIKSKISVPN